MAVVDEIGLVREVEKLLKEIRTEIRYAESNVNYFNSVPPSPSYIICNDKSFQTDHDLNMGLLPPDNVVNSPTTTTNTLSSIHGDLNGYLQGGSFLFPLFVCSFVVFDINIIVKSCSKSGHYLVQITKNFS